VKGCLDFVVFALIIVLIALFSISTHDDNVIICGGVVIVMVFLGMFFDWQSSRPVKVKFRQKTRTNYQEKAKIGEDGELVSSVSSPSPSWFRFSGRGTNITSAVYLEGGLYSIEYRLSTSTATVIELISVDNPGESKEILRVSASGSQTFRVADSGRYIFQVKPPDSNAAWTIKCALI
jgi:hypothetical protein